MSINSTVTPPIPAELGIDFSPVGDPVDFIIGGVPYADPVWAPSVSYIETDTVITFDATGTTNQFVNYEWDFGDGGIGYGATATHTYEVSSIHFRVVLKGTLSDGRTMRVSKQIYVTAP